MLKEKELSDPNSCINRAKPGEMTFVLLGRDSAAGDAVVYWINRRIELGLNKADDPQIIEAMNAAQIMRRQSKCPGNHPEGIKDKCCDRAGEYNGYGSGPTVFRCPKQCTCHD